ncbi:MAG: DUF805 domain-containing protein [Paramuribaculum sp.]|nr:DUF805 domain-containing protein [Paramuribaculum sp.]MDE6323037.1 DUF805 domain-containing protein [Paramuribaculum sp.]
MVYYIMYQGQVTGPMNREQIFAYGVNRDTMVSADGGDWRPLYTYPELMELLSRGTGAAPEYHPAVQRQVSFMEAIKIGMSKYAVFSGRASRSEFWWWILFTYIISFVTAGIGQGIWGNDLVQFALSGDIADLPIGFYSFTGIVNLLFFLPTLAVSVRRLHDTGRSGWFYLLNFLCCIGSIILLVWYCQESKAETNEYGPVPNEE